MTNVFKNGGQWRPTRIVGMMILLLALAGNCTGKGCKSCQSCQSCSSCQGPQGPGVSKPGEQPGGPGGPGEEPVPSWTKETRPSPYRPVSVLPSDTSTFTPSPEQQEQARKMLEDMLVRGEGVNQPASPVNLTASPVKGILVSLNWQDAANNETEYQVDRSQGNGPFATVFRLPANTGSITDGPLPQGSYSYRVRALNNTGASPFAGPAAVTLDGATTVPAAPVALTASADPSPKVILLWEDQSEDEEYFKVERAQGRGAFAAIATLGQNANSYNDAAVNDGITYSYRVLAGNKAGESAPSNVASAKVKVADKPPAAPTNLSFTEQDQDNVQLQWDDNSDNEDRFVIEQSPGNLSKFRRMMEVPRDQASVVIANSGVGESWKYQVRAENAAGQSDPSNSVTVEGKDKPVTMYTLTVDPSGNISASPPQDPSMPSLEVRSVSNQGGSLVAEIAVRNNDPSRRLEEVFILVESSDQPGITLADCDRGPASCSLDEGISGGNPVGYQYVEGGLRGTAPHGGEMETYPSQQGFHFAVRDIAPACGSVAVKWTFAGLTAAAQLGVNLYANQTPADFRSDPRFDPNKILFMVEPMAPGPGTDLYKPGARNNPSSRPINYLIPGDVVAVNVSVEAADWMENQPEIGRLADEPKANYIYWRNLGFGITFDPAVLKPIPKPVVLPNGERLNPGIQDPQTSSHLLDDGWSAEGSLCFSFMVPADGLVETLLDYPAFQVGTDDNGNPACLHCGQEGFVGQNGVITGPDPEPEATLGLVYFQVVGEPGTGTALRLFPRSNTTVEIYSTNGTLSNWNDDLYQDRSMEISTRLPMTTDYPGEYQVQESYICVQ